MLGSRIGRNMSSEYSLVALSIHWHLSKTIHQSNMNFICLYLIFNKCNFIFQIYLRKKLFRNMWVTFFNSIKGPQNSLKLIKVNWKWKKLNTHSQTTNRANFEHRFLGFIFIYLILSDVYIVVLFNDNSDNNGNWYFNFKI